MQVKVTSFGDRDAGVAAAPPRGERPDDAPLLFQRADVAKQHVKRQGRYVHRSSLLDARLLPHLERLDDVLDPDVVVADADAALEALADLGHVVLEPAQALDREVVGDDHAVPDDPRLAVAGDQAGADDAARDAADARHPEDLADLRRAELGLLELGLEHALERGLHFLDRLVDDRVVADVDALAGRQLARPAGRPDVEADDHRVGGDGQVHVVLRDGANAAADDPELDLLADVELEQRVLQGFHRAGHVALDDQQEFLALAGLQDRVQVLERDPSAARGELGSTLARLAALGDLPRHPVVGDDEEVVTRLRDRGEAEHLHRTRRRRLAELVEVLVEHGTDAAVGLARHDRVTDVQRAALYKHGRHRAAALVELGLDRDALRVLVRVGPQVERSI